MAFLGIRKDGDGRWAPCAVLVSVREQTRSTTPRPHNRDMSRKAFIVLVWVVLCLGLLSGFSQSNPTRQQQIEAHNRKAAEYLQGG